MKQEKLEQEQTERTERGVGRNAPLQLRAQPRSSPNFSVPSVSSCSPVVLSLFAAQRISVCSVYSVVPPFFIRSLCFLLFTFVLTLFAGQRTSECSVYSVVSLVFISFHLFSTLDTSPVH